jgi:hypothetical protein
LQCGILDFVVVTLPLALIDSDLAALYFHYICAVILADENYVNLTILSLVSDVDGWNHNPGFLEIVEETSDYYGLGMFQAGNFEVGRKDLCHGGNRIARISRCKRQLYSRLATHLAHMVVIEAVQVRGQGMLIFRYFLPFLVCFLLLLISLPVFLISFLAAPVLLLAALII